MSIDVNVTNDLVIVTESSEDIVVNVSNAAGPAGVGVPVGGTTNQVLKKLSGTNYDTYWAVDNAGVPYSGASGNVNLGAFSLTATSLIKSGGTSSQFLKADGSVDSSVYYLASNPSGYTTNVGTVTSVGLSSVTSGVTIGSTPVTTSGTITLAIATATTSQNGLLSSTDWTTFNGKQGTITLTTTGTSGAATFSSNTLNIPNYGSALSGYLPLTGGTLTGALSGTSATFIGNVGINTTSLAVPLTVRGTTDRNFEVSGSSGVLLISSVDNGRTLYKNFGIDGSSLFLQSQSGGNVLIGATDVGYKLDVNGTARVSGALSANSFIPTSSSVPTNGMYSSAANTLNFATNTTNRLSIASTGAASFSSTSGVPVSVTSTAVTSTFVLDNTNANLWGGVYAVRVNGVDKNYFGTLGSLLGTTNTDATIWATSGNGFRVYTNGNNRRLEISSTGAAEFTSSVTATSLIKSGGTSSQYLMADGSTSTLTNPVTGTGTTNYLPKFTGASTIGNSQIFDNGGSIGINITDASFPLEVSSNAGGSSIKIRGRATANTGTLRFYSNDNATQLAKFEANDSSIELGSITNVPLLFYQNASERMRLTSTGLGIGTTSPSFLLDVNGTGRFVGQTTFGNTLQVTGSANVPASGAGLELAATSSLTAITSFNRSLGTYLGANYNAISHSFAISGVEKFFIASTGAATFSSSVTATSFNGTTNNIFTAGGIEYMRLTGAGNLLLGSTSDTSERLQVTGSIKASNTITSLSAIFGTYFGPTTSTASNPGFRVSVGTGIFDPGGANIIGFSTNSTERLRITSTGAAEFSSTIKTAAPSGGTAKPFKIGAAASVSPTSPNRTIEIEIDGTTYYLSAKTTND